jgi:molybdenum cofactor cytidylyltransferase
MWESGMGRSISAGVKGALHSRKNWDALIISTCDQPYLSCDIFNLLIANHRNAAKIVASAYDGTFGVPVLFSGEFVNELKQLGGNDGAKKVIKNHQDKLVTVPFVHGECDIDTEADWQSFLEQNSGTI